MLLISNAKEMFLLLLLLFYIYLGNTHSGLKHTVMKDGFDALANNGRRLGETVSAFDLSLPLCCPPRTHPSSDRGGACAWPSVGVADATTSR